MIDLHPEERLIVALDVMSSVDAITLIEKLSEQISVFKIGYALMFDPHLCSVISLLKSRGKQIFLDAKLNDIPETVRRGVITASRWGFDFITVHSDTAMLQAAVDGSGGTVKIMAVTALTSMPAEASRDRFRAGLINAMVTGCDGVIMSPTDLLDPIGLVARVPDRLGSVRELLGDMIIATPGVRLTRDDEDDHERAGSPAMARRHGADYLIVGRPIITSDDPATAAYRYLNSLY